MTPPEVWRPATVLSCDPAADEMVKLVIRPVEAVRHRAGQHYEVRIPGSDLGRKYSIVSAPSRIETIELGVQVLRNGLVSPRLARLMPGDRLDIRGPIGRGFVWEAGNSASLLLLGGGAGITPLLSMWSLFHESGPRGVCRFLATAKNSGRIYRFAELDAEISFHFSGGGRRISPTDVATAAADLPLDDLAVRICGPSSFAGAMADALLELGVSESRIRSEGFA